jgi:triphosphoribosyl-dephospho-CoA synthetase
LQRRRFRWARPSLPPIEEIDIWRAAQLILKRYGDEALKESGARADELVAAGDDNGAAMWRRITDAVAQLANKTPPGMVH